MLTEDMTRLSSEIGGLRRERAGLIQQLVNGSQQRHKSVAEFRSNANGSFKAATNALRHKRNTGLNQIRQEVSNVRRAMKDDLMGVRKAWSGEGMNSAAAFGGKSTFSPSPKARSGRS